MSDAERLQLQSTITCPQCGCKKSETMPVDSCQVLYECQGCKAPLRPKTGDCCVFCSYGTVPCPPIQQARQPA
jgi:hypothetical protein